MHLSNLIAEIESSFKQYKSAGLIDRASLYMTANQALKKFGQSIAVRQECIVKIENKQGHLPSNFHSLALAVKCSPDTYYCKEEDIPVLQSSLMWKEKITRSSVFSSCSPCCKEESCEKVITENVYINDRKLSLYYKEPTILKLKKGFKRSLCSNDCRNKVVSDSPYEISIMGTKLYTNFDSGVVYMQYYGLEMEEEDDRIPVIPDTNKGEVYNYIEAVLKEKVCENILTSGDDPSIGQLLQFYSTKASTIFPRAMNDAKFATLTPDSYRKVAASNRRDMARIEFLLPTI